MHPIFDNAKDFSDGKNNSRDLIEERRNFKKTSKNNGNVYEEETIREGDNGFTKKTYKKVTNNTPHGTS